MSVVLVVEDDSSTRLLVKLILEQAGHDVVEAAHGAEALALIGPQLRPDVVMTDLRMPVRGEELIRRLRSEAPTAAIPIVVVSDDLVAAWTLKAQGFVDAVVPKPFDPAALAQCIHAVAKREGTQPVVAHLAGGIVAGNGSLSVSLAARTFPK